AFDGGVFDFGDAGELVEERALLFGEFGWDDDAHVDVEVAFAAVRIGQALPFAAEKSAGLRAFGNGERVFAIDGGHFDFRAESSLRDADGDVAIEVGAAAFEERMLFDFEEDVEVAGDAAVGSGFAFAGDAQAHAAIHARGNGNFDGVGAFDAALSAAIGAGFLDDLSRAVAIGASARDGEESLLIVHLAAPFAGFARGHGGAGLGAGAVAGGAIF